MTLIPVYSGRCSSVQYIEDTKILPKLYKTSYGKRNYTHGHIHRSIQEARYCEFLQRKHRSENVVTEFPVGRYKIDFAIYENGSLAKFVEYHPFRTSTETPTYWLKRSAIVREVVGNIPLEVVTNLKELKDTEE